MFSVDSSVWRYKVYAYIRGDSPNYYENFCQTYSILEHVVSGLIMSETLTMFQRAVLTAETDKSRGLARYCTGFLCNVRMIKRKLNIVGCLTGIADHKP